MPPCQPNPHDPDDSPNDDDLDDSEFPDDDDIDDHDHIEAQTLPFPFCKHPLYEFAEVCPHCHNYISREDAPPPTKPVWILFGAVSLLATAAVYLLLRIYGCQS